MQAVLGRIKYLVESLPMNQSEMARRLGMDPSNLSKYLSGRLPVSRALINSLVVDLGVSKQWLTDGAGVPFPKSDQLQTVDCESVITTSSRRGVPVYDVDVTAGCMPLERLLTVDRIKGYIDMPHINPGSIVVRVSGDSMEPKIIDGGYIVIRPIKSTANIFWGQIYVILTEDYRLVKYLRRYPGDDSMVILHSANPDYDDMDVSRSDIQALFIVESILNIKSLC